MSYTDLMRQAFQELSENLKFLAAIDIRFYIGVFAAILSVIFGFHLSKKRNNRRANRIAEAKKNGHVIEAHKIDSRVQHYGKGPSIHTATYAYTANGKERQYVAKHNNFLPEAISLYYDKTPDRVFSAYEGDPAGLFIMLPYFIFVPLGTLWLVATMLGYRW